MNLGFDVDSFGDPYAAMVEICQRPLVFRAVVLSMQSVYPQELSILAALARRFPHLELVLCDVQGRPAATQQALRLGATGLLEGDTIRTPNQPPAKPPQRPDEAQPLSAAEAEALAAPAAAPIPDGPVLTPEELKALLGDAD